jgi:intracellular sulfur oxidation DsrE/DsrF family protein
MKKNIGFISKVVMLTLSLLLLFSGPISAGMAMKHGSGHGMVMHHQHVMLNHALGMALEGSNLVMLGEMGMAQGIDKTSVDHGKMMMKNGRNLWNETMSGDVMMKMHGGGTTPADNPMMKYTHELAETQLKVMDLLSKMPSSSLAGHDMVMHHQHTMMNHALKMALEGSNLIMLGQMGMAKGVDEISIEHGKHMIKNATTLFNDVMSGETMMEMHGKGIKPEKDSGMAYTHELGEAQLKVINLLNTMPTVTE